MTVFCPGFQYLYYMIFQAMSSKRVGKREREREKSEKKKTKVAKSQKAKGKSSLDH